MIGFTSKTLYLSSPPTQASGIVLSEVSDTQLVLSLTRGNGRKVLITAALTSATQAIPVNNTTYTASTVYASGTQIGVGNYIVYNGDDDAPSFLITGLTNNTSYTFYAYEYNYVANGSEKFNRSTATNNPKTQATIQTVVAPTTQATDLIFLGVQRLEWTSGNGSRRIVVAKQGSAVDSLPVDGTTYTASPIFGSGTQLGTGNYVLYDGTAAFMDDLSNLSFNTQYHFRVFEYNIATGLPLYKTATATGNPLSHTTIADEVWYHHTEPIAQARRDTPGLSSTSNIFSKVYTGCYLKLSDEHQLLTVADNNTAGAPANANVDQGFLWTRPDDGGAQSFKLNWVLDLNGGTGGEPIPVFKRADHASATPTLWDEFQQWPATATVNADDDIDYPYSSNISNVAGRYSLGFANSTDGGRTITRNNAAVLLQASGNNYYQFAQRVYDSANSRWIWMINNFGAGTESRAMSTDLYTSPSASELVLTKVASNILAGTQIDKGGFGLFGPMWITGADVFFVANVGVKLPAAISDPIDHEGTDGYNFLSSGVGLISFKKASVAAPKLIIERVLYSSPQESHRSLFPGSVIIDHGGLQHIIVSRFHWKLEAGAQEAMDIGLLSTGIMSDNGAYAIGRDVYPGYVKKFYLPHQTKLDDTYNSSTVYPKEVIGNETGTTSGTPVQYAWNRIIPTSGYVQYASFTHDQDALGVSIIIDNHGTGGSSTHGICEKLGTFSISVIENSTTRYLDVTLTGHDGNQKHYKTTSLLSNIDKGAWIYRYTRVGFTAIKNAGVIELKLNVENTLDVPVTKTLDQTITSIAQTANAFTLGHVNGQTNVTNPVGACIIMDGTYCTQQNWLIENLK